MHIQPTSQIDFKAKYIKSAHVDKLERNFGKYANKKVALVKISPYNKLDTDALTAIRDMWQSMFAVPDILKTINKIRKEGFENFKYDIYALTSQTKNFKKLDPKKILGVADIYPLENKKAFICDLEVKRNYRHGNKKPSFKHVGTGFLNVFKTMFDTIELQSVYMVTNFYEKNGFELIDGDRLLYSWCKKIAQNK